MSFVDTISGLETPDSVRLGFQLADALDRELAAMGEGAVLTSDTDPALRAEYMDQVKTISQLLVKPLLDDDTDVVGLYSALADRGRRVVHGEGYGRRNYLVLAESDQLIFLAQSLRVGVPTSHHKHNGIEATSPVSHQMLWRTGGMPLVINPGDTKITTPGEEHSHWYVGATEQAGIRAKYGRSLIIATAGFRQVTRVPLHPNKHVPQLTKTHV